MTRLIAMLFLVAACGDDDTGSEPMEDAGASQLCVNIADCADGVFCNGTEQCDPEHPSADERGCVSGTSACLETQTCDETAAMCITQCGVAADADGDGHDAQSCGGDDCDDSNPDRYPGNTEICDVAGVDEDCDPSTLGEDMDGDGEVALECCNAVGGSISCGLDCDDDRDSVSSGGTEVCNGVDEDCDGDIDEGVMTTQYADFDGDGFGNIRLARDRACVDDPLWTTRAGDCDDANPERNPEAAEVCDGIDNDCDAEDGDETDLDRDGHLDPASTCEEEGGSLLKDDCDDLNPSVFPGAPEQCNGINDDCDLDSDGDAQIDERSGVLGADAYCQTVAGSAEAYCSRDGRGLPTCIVSTCPPGAIDCDSDARNGCEVEPLTDQRNCGGCGIRCDDVCVDGLCAEDVGDCSAGCPPGTQCEDDRCVGRPDISPVAAVTLNDGGGCLAREAGDLECWGTAFFLALGPRPLRVPEGTGGYVRDARDIALSRNQLYFSRGANRTLARIGGSSSVPQPFPESMPLTSIAALSGGGNSGAAIVDDGTLYAWGSILTDGSTAVGETPMDMQSVLSRSGFADLDVDRVDAGSGIIDLLCATTLAGDVACTHPAIDIARTMSTGRSGAFRHVAILPGVGSYQVCVAEESGAGSDIVCGEPGVGFSQVATSAAEVTELAAFRVGGAPSICWATDSGAWCLSTAASPPAPFGGYDAACGDSADLAQACGLWSCDSMGGDDCRGSGAYQLSIPLARSLEDSFTTLPGPTAMAATEGALCAVSEGLVQCFGQASPNVTAVGPDEVPLTNPQRGRSVVRGVASSLNHACARRDNGTLACWGHNEAAPFGELSSGSPDTYLSSGQIVDSPNTLVFAPVPVSVTEVRDVAAGGFATCVAHTDGEVSCWGEESSPTRFITTETEPTRVAGLSQVTQLSVAHSHACALDDAGVVSCWGSNAVGELGRDCTDMVCAPDAVPLETIAAEVEAGGARLGVRGDICAADDYACARLANGEVHCWGGNTYGQLGVHPSLVRTREEPTAVPGIRDAVALSVGPFSVCAVIANGTVSCWGIDANLVGATGESCGATGACGNPTSLVFPCATEPYEVPGLTDIEEVAVGFLASCARDRQGVIRCWGSNEGSQLGDGTIADRRFPGPPVVLPGPAVALEGRGETFFAVLTGGEVYAWGSDEWGRRGDGATPVGGSTRLPTLIPGL